MSIINQMLRDLDARHAGANERLGLPSNLRALPPEQAARPQGLPWLAAGLLACAVGAGFLWFGQPAPRSEPLSATVAAAPDGEQALPFPVEPKPTPSSMPPTQKPVSAAVVKPAPVPPSAAARPARPMPAPVAETAERPAQPVMPAPAAVGEFQIDKQPKEALSRDQAGAEYQKGLQAAGMGDHAGALPPLRRALELDPGHAKARQALLSVLASSRQWEEVKQVARNGLLLDPARSGWAVILARLQHEQGNTEAAVKTLEIHAGDAIGDADYQGLFAFLLQKRGRHAEAAQHYQAALALRPNEGRWWYGLGFSLEAAGRGDDALAAFGKARDSGNLPAEMLGLVEQKLK